MKLKQLSVFLENKPGRLRELCAVLAENGINIITLSLADTEQFGILRLIIKDYDKAKALLTEKGFVAKLTDVVAVEVNNQPGGLSEILKIEEESGISVEYMYAFTIKSGENAVLLFRFDDMDKALEALQQAALGKNDQSLNQWMANQQIVDNPRVAEKITVRDDWNVAVECVLGDYLEATCVEQIDPLCQFLDSLVCFYLGLIYCIYCMFQYAGE